MTIAADLVREFDARFAFELEYGRAGTFRTMRGLVRGLTEREQSELVGDAGQDTLFFMAEVAVMLAAGVYPPQKFDRVRVDGMDRALQSWRVSREAGVPLFVKGFVKG